jgi:hypothetical protein
LVQYAHYAPKWRILRNFQKTLPLTKLRCAFCTIPGAFCANSKKSWSSQVGLRILRNSWRLLRQFQTSGAKNSSVSCDLSNSLLQHFLLYSDLNASKTSSFGLF